MQRPAAIVVIAVVGGFAQPRVATAGMPVEFARPGPLNTNASTDRGIDQFPIVHTDRVGRWITLWGSTDSLNDTIGDDWDILIARSDDDGQTWTAPASLHASARTDAGRDQFPQIATDGAETWVAAWVSQDSLQQTVGQDDDILVSTSTDAGVSWSRPQPLNTDAQTDRRIDRSVSITTDARGQWVAVWHGYLDVNGDYDVFVARSTDAGRSWTSPALLAPRSGLGRGGHQFPTIATDGHGTWLATWHSYDSLGGALGLDLDIVAAVSKDGGATWAQPTIVNDHAFDDDGVDYAPRVATNGQGVWMIT